jgi:uncharacterized protein (DUF488 family)
MRGTTWKGQEVFDLGHSTRSSEELVDLLWTFGIATLVDIRTIPRSRHNPQFVKQALAATLERAGVRYVHVPELGGLRHARADSPNGGWHNASFRGFADYMLTPEFEEGVAKLRMLPGPLALMCAEAVPWRCHRSLVADALVARGATVRHVTSRTRAEAHRLTPFARVVGTRITYPPEQGSLFFTTSTGRALGSRSRS